MSEPEEVTATEDPPVESQTSDAKTATRGCLKATRYTDKIEVVKSNDKCDCKLDFSNLSHKCARDLALLLDAVAP